MIRGELSGLTLNTFEQQECIYTPGEGSITQFHISTYDHCLSCKFAQILLYDSIQLWIEFDYNCFSPWLCIDVLLEIDILGLIKNKYIGR